VAGQAADESELQHLSEPLATQLRGTKQLLEQSVERAEVEQPW
jgi:hypothetical protein